MPTPAQIFARRIAAERKRQDAEAKRIAQAARDAKVAAARRVASRLPIPVAARHGAALPKPINFRVARTKLEAAIARAEKEMRAATEALNRGDISIAGWKRRMEQAIRDVNSAADQLARGGRAGLTRAEVKAIEDRIAQQQKYLDRFAAQIASGEQALGQGAVNRSAMYANSARGTFEAAKQGQAAAQGLKYEKNVLGPAEHCSGADSCLEQSARGWQPIGTLIPVGERLCISNCHCSMQYANRVGGKIVSTFGA